MTKTLLSFIIFATLLGCSASPDEKDIYKQEPTKNKKIDSIIKYRHDGTKEYLIPTINGIKTGNKLWFDDHNHIMGFEQYKNDTLDGYGIMLNKNFRPKYLFEKNKGKRDGVLIEFYHSGVIKSFSSAGVINDSQKIKFYEDGTIKQIGQTKKGRGHGTFYYFDKNGMLEKTVEYENGNVKN